MPHTHVLTHLSVATLAGDSGYGLIENGAIAIEGERIVFVGPIGDLPGAFAHSPTTDLGGYLVTPGLIDCHTHLVHAGSRAKEFEMRLNGASYEEIAQSGGGIISTVTATRAASEDDLRASALRRLDQMLACGVTTVEIKSGYGLDIDTELRMLRVARSLEKQRPVRIRTTFLGAHAIPAGTDADDYLDRICLPALKAAAEEGLVDAVDGFCETIAFTPAQIERVFDAAAALGLPVKLHAEQLSNQEGAALAARHDALSADHLEYLSETGVAEMANAGTVAVLLPGAFYALGETQLPPIQALRTSGVPMALATDCNPGSSPMTSLPLAMNMGAILFGLTPQETLRGATVNAARALGLSDVGAISIGQRADLAVWQVASPAELTYRIGDVPLHARYFGGTKC
jgi:imidazolonepropionase